MALLVEACQRPRRYEPLISSNPKDLVELFRRLMRRTRRI